MVNIICMKWGDKFPPLYVNRLYAMVEKNLTIPFRFVCFTEKSNGIRAEVEIQPLPELDLPKGIPERGWRKLTVFAKQFGGLEGATLFLDLDVVIVDNIDELFSVDGEFLIIKDHKRRHRLEGNSSVFRFEIGKHSDILDYFINNFEKVRSEVRHEQAYLSKQMHKKGILKFWQTSWMPSFKYHCAPNLLISWFKAPTIPDNAKIIIFHGLPNPPEAIKGISGKWYRHLKPATWIEKYWVSN